MKKFFVFASSLVLTTTILNAQLKAFPTAEGFGSNATGGRGGVVIEVTNLQDDATGATVGSLRWALNQSKSVPATIVFRVGGIIKLVADLRSTRTAGTTIAGQTAPGDGITIRGAKTNLGGSSNLIVRNIRFRIGLKGDTAFAAGGSIGIENASNFILDHCVFGWSGEENMTLYDNTLTTVQWCLLHEGLYASGHAKGARSYGSQWGGQSATYHHNLLAHNYNRSPRFNGARSNDLNVLVDFVNNVNYNWGKENSCYGGDIERISHRANFVNNYYKPGPVRPGTSTSYFVQSSYNAIQGTTKIAQWYMNGNHMEGTANTSRNTDNYTGLDASYYVNAGVSKTSLISASPFVVTDPVTTQTAAEAYVSVLAKAGTIHRDTTERRILSEVRKGTASGKGTSIKYLNSDGTTYSNNGFYNVAKGIIDNPSLAFGPEIAYPSTTWTSTVVDADHDGMDDAWELANGLNPSDPADRNTLAPSGYTALEVYLNSLMGETIPFGTNLKKNASTSQIGIYSNPAGNQIRIISSEVIHRYQITDLTGKRLQQGSNQDLTYIDVASLPKGVFLLTLGTELAGNQILKFNK